MHSRTSVVAFALVSLWSTEVFASGAQSCRTIVEVLRMQGDEDGAQVFVARVLLSKYASGHGASCASLVGDRTIKLKPPLRIEAGTIFALDAHVYSDAFSGTGTTWQAPKQGDPSGVALARAVKLGDVDCVVGIRTTRLRISNGQGQFTGTVMQTDPKCAWLRGTEQSGKPIGELKTQSAQERLAEMTAAAKLGRVPTRKNLQLELRLHYDDGLQFQWRVPTAPKAQDDPG